MGATSSTGQGEEEECTLTRVEQQHRTGRRRGVHTHKGATSSERLGAQPSQSRGLVLHGVIFFPVLSGLGQGHNEKLLPQGVLHLLIVGGLVEVAGEQLGQQLLQDIGEQEQQPTEPHSAQAVGYVRSEAKGGEGGEGQTGRRVNFKTRHGRIGTVAHRPSVCVMNGLTMSGCGVRGKAGRGRCGWGGGPQEPSLWPHVGERGRAGAMAAWWVEQCAMPVLSAIAIGRAAHMSQESLAMCMSIMHGAGRDAGHMGMPWSQS